MQEKVLNVRVNGIDKAIKNVEELSGAFNELSDNAEGLTALDEALRGLNDELDQLNDEAESFNELNEASKKPAKNIDELKKNVEELEAAFNQAEFGSDEFKRLQGELIVSRSKLKQLDEETEGLTSTQKLEAFAGLGEAITEAFAVGSVLGEFTEQSELIAASQEKIEKALLLVQSARAIAEGVKQAAILKSIALQKIQSLTTAKDTTTELANTAAKNASSASLKGLGGSIKGVLPQLTKFGIVGAAVAAGTAQLYGATKLSANSFGELGTNFKEASIPMKALYILLAPMIIGFTNLRIAVNKISEAFPAIGETLNEAKDAIYGFIGVETEAAKASRLASEQFVKQREEQEALDASTTALTDATIEYTKANIANAAAATLVGNALKNQQLEEQNAQLETQTQEIEGLIALYGKYSAILETTGVSLNDLNIKLNELKTDTIKNNTEIVNNNRESAIVTIEGLIDEAETRKRLIDEGIEQGFEAANSREYQQKLLNEKLKKLDEDLFIAEKNLQKERLQGSITEKKEAELFLEQQKINFKEREKLIAEFEDKLQSIEDKRQKRFKDENARQKEAIDAAKSILEASKKIGEQAEKDVQDIIIGALTSDDVLKASEEAFKKQVSKFEQFLKDNGQAILEGVISLTDDINEYLNALDEKNIEALNAQIEERTELIGEYESAITESLSRIEELEDNLTTSRLDNRDAIIASIRREQEAIKKNREAAIAAEEEKKRLEAEAEKIAKRKAERNKTIAIGETIIDTAIAIGKAIAETPTTFGLPFSAFAAAQGALRVATISQQQFAEGGYTGDGDKYEVAGVVHKGEYVVPKNIVENSRFAPILNTLEAERTKGYADGGNVTDIDTNKIIEGLNALANRPVVVSVEQFERVQKNSNIVRVKSEF